MEEVTEMVFILKARRDEILKSDPHFDVHLDDVCRKEETSFDANVVEEKIGGAVGKRGVSTKKKTVRAAKKAPREAMGDLTI